MVQAPHLFASVFAYEPGHPSWLRDAGAIAAYEQDAFASFGPIFDAVGRGDSGLALERLLDVAGGRVGYFASQPDAVRRGQLDNARTLPLLLGQESARALSPGDLRAAGVPLRVAYGSRTGAMYRLVGAALPDSRVIEGAGHMWPQEDPPAFCAEVLAWLAP
jgi:pimeloyl-ACP methyl ester carboxylesterase